MKLLFVIHCLFLAACASTTPSLVAIRGATIVNVADGSLQRNQTVLIEGDEIIAVKPTDQLDIPVGADVVDATGGYLIPGLWDMHVHSIANIAADMGVESVAAWEWHFPVFLAYGITGVRNMNDGTGDATLELTNAVKRRLADGSLHGPRLIANGPSIDGDPPLGSNSAVVRSASEARAVVDVLVENGADFIKVYENLSRDTYFALMDQARRRGIPVDGHIPFRVTPEEAAHAGQPTFEHVLAMAAGCSTDAAAERERFDQVLAPMRGSPALENLTPMTLFHHERALYDSRDPAVCKRTIGTYLNYEVAEAPNIVAYRDVVNAGAILADETTMHVVPEDIRRNWKATVESAMYPELRSLLEPMVPLYIDNARLLHEAGVVLLAASDVGIPALIPGLSLHEELELLVDAGLTPLESLQTATLNPARVLGLERSLGAVEAGKIADLVLLDANPVENIANTRRIRAVVASGRLYRRIDLDRLLTTAEKLH